MNRIRNSLKPNRPKKLVLIAVGLGVSLIAYSIARHWFRQYQFESGLESHQQGDCNQALSALSSYLDGVTSKHMGEQEWQAHSIQTECQSWQALVKEQRSGKAALALDRGRDFIKQYPKSPMSPKLRQLTTHLFTDNPSQRLAIPATCDQIDDFTNHQLLPPDQAPPFYQACGQNFLTNQKVGKAISVFEKFLAKFPNSDQVPQVKRAYAQALFNESSNSKAGTLPSPIRSGTTSNGTTVVEIRNDSPHKMRIVFTGPNARVEDLPACKDCHAFTTPPAKCPAKGAVGRYNVDPGKYKILVKATSGHSVVPFRGEWSFNRNSFYNHCFFVVRKAPGLTPKPTVNLNLPSPYNKPTVSDLKKTLNTPSLSDPKISKELMKSLINKELMESLINIDDLGWKPKPYFSEDLVKSLK